MEPASAAHWSTSSTATSCATSRIGRHGPAESEDTALTRRGQERHSSLSLLPSREQSHGASYTRNCLHSFLHLNHVIGDKAVRFAVDGDRGFSAGGLDQAEDLAGLLVEPVAHILDAMLFLDLQVGLMRLGDSLGRQPVDMVVNIHEQRHMDAPVAGINER